ncbi:MAG: hypothetical protein AAF558_08730 [Verrucomicrobiota bacterium]
MRQKIRHSLLLICVMLVSACATYQNRFETLERYTEFTRNGVTYTQCSAAYPTGSLATSVIRLDKIVPKQALANKEFAFQFIITNLTGNELRNVVIIDDVPKGFRVLSSNPQATVANGIAKWVVPSIGPNSKFTINAKGSSPTVGKISSCGSVRYDDYVCATTEIVDPGLKATVSAPAKANLCDTLPLVYTATNVGSVKLTNVFIDGGKTSELVALDGTRGGSMRIGDLMPGESKQIRVNAKATKNGRNDTIIRAVSDQITSQEAKAVTMVESPQLRIGVSSPSSVIQGRSITYEITVSNVGKGTAERVNITSPIPAGTTFLSASNGGTAGAGGITWPAVRLPAGSSTKLQARVRASSTSQVRTDATATTECAQPASAFAQTTVKGVAAILLEVVDNPDPIEVGDTTTYTITVTNQGSATDTNIRVNCAIESALSYVSTAGATTGKASGNIVTFAPLPSLAPKATATWTVRVKGNAASDSRFKVTMNSDQLGARPVEETEATKIY